MKRDMEPEVLAAAAAGDPVALTRVLVATPSVNPELEEGGAGEAEIAGVAAQWLESWGFETTVSEVATGRFNVLAHLDGSGPVLLLNGHLDTVGVAGMSVAPFGSALDGDRLWGRGSCDMKGGLGALLAAAYRLSRDGARPNLIVLLTADEEHASVGMASFVGDTPMADLAVVCEPTGLAVMPAHKGFVWMRVSFRGHAAHGSRPDLGVDAIQHAGLFLAALEAHTTGVDRPPTHRLLGGGSIHAGTIRGGVAESVYPEACELTLECRTLPGESPDDAVSGVRSVLEALEVARPSLDAEIEVTLSRPGTEVPEDSELVRGLLAASARHAVDPRVVGMTAWVDAAYLNEAGVPAVCFGPGDLEQAHTATEWIDVREIRTCADILETFARDLAEE